MDSVKKNTKLHHEKKIKSKLVNIRKVIQNKFRKVKRGRIMQENRLNRKYKPITKELIS